MVDGEEADLRGPISILRGSVRGAPEGGLRAAFGGGSGGATFPGLTLTGLIFTGLILTGLGGLIFTGLGALTFTGFEALVLRGLEEPRPTLHPGMVWRVEGRWEAEEQEGRRISRVSQQTGG